MNSGRHALLGLLFLALSAAAAVFAGTRGLRDGLRVAVSARPLFSSQPSLELVASVGAAESSPTTQVGSLHHVQVSAQHGSRPPTRLQVTQLVGPFQNPAQLPCTVRVTVPPAFLDPRLGGASSTFVLRSLHQAQSRAPNNAASFVSVAKTALDAELRGQTFWPLGAYREVTKLSVELGNQQSGSRDLYALAVRAIKRAHLPPSTGFLGLRVTLRLDRATIPVRVAVVPHPVGLDIGFALELAASIEFDSRLLNWVADLAGADRLATKAIRHALAHTMGPLLAPPPALDLGGLAPIALQYCRDNPVQVDPGSGISVSFAVPFVARPNGEGPPAIEGNLPSHPWLTTQTGQVHEQPIVELGIDGLNALLYESWRTGALDQALDDAALTDLFNEHELVRALLSVRIDTLRLELPPVLSPSPSGSDLELALVGIGTLRDGKLTSLAHLVADATLAPVGAPGRPTPQLHLSATLDDATLACERRAGDWRPCYELITTALLDQAPRISAQVSAALAGWLTRLFIGQELTIASREESIEIRGAAAELERRSRSATANPNPNPNAANEELTVIRLVLDAVLRAP